MVLYPEPFLVCQARGTSDSILVKYEYEVIRASLCLDYLYTFQNTVSDYTNQID